MTKKTEVSKKLSLNELYRLYREGKNDEADVCGNKRIEESMAEIHTLLQITLKSIKAKKERR